MADKRQCARCGRPFEPARPHFTICTKCYRDTLNHPPLPRVRAPLNTVSTKHRIGGGTRQHGGVWRLSDGYEPASKYIKFPAAETSTRDLVLGVNRFLSAWYQRQTRISDILRREGLRPEEIACFHDEAHIRLLVDWLCAEIRNWFIQHVGQDTSKLLIAWYGLYGDPPQPLDAIAETLEMDEDHARRRQLWALNKLRHPDLEPSLPALVRDTARRKLPDPANHE
jgi:hypothetical protein